MRHDGLVSVRYMVDDVDKAIDFYTKQFAFELGHQRLAGVRRSRPRQPAAAPRRPKELGRTADAGRTPTGPRRLEPHPLRRRRHRGRGRPAPFSRR